MSSLFTGIPAPSKLHNWSLLSLCSPNTVATIPSPETSQPVSIKACKTTEYHIKQPWKLIISAIGLSPASCEREPSSRPINLETATAVVGECLRLTQLFNENHDATSPASNHPMFSKPSVDFSLISNPPLGDHESNRVSRFLRPLLTSAKGTTMTTPQIVIIRASDDSNESTNIPRDENTLRGFGPQIAHGAPIAKFPSELVAENITPQPLQSKDSDVTQLVIHVPESSSNMTNGRPPSHTGQDSTHSSREALDQTFVPIAMNVAGELVEPVKATPKVKGQTMVRQIRRMLLKRPILTLLLGREVAARVEPLLEIVARGLEVPLLAPAAPAPMTTSDGPYNSTTGVGRAPLAAIIGTSTVPAGRVVPGELPGEALEETSEEVPKELSGEALEETSEEVPKELSGEALVAVPGIQQRESLVQMPVEIPAEVPIELPVNLAAEVRREQLGEISPGGVLDVSSEVRPDKVPGGTAPERAPEGASAIAPAAT